MFIFENETPIPGPAPKPQGKEGLGGPQGMAETETRDKGKIAIEGLSEYYRSIQQSVSPQERKMEKLAQQQANDIAAIRRDGIKVNNLGPQGAVFAT